VDLARSGDFALPDTMMPCEITKIAKSFILPCIGRMDSLTRVGVCRTEVFRVDADPRSDRDDRRS